MKVAVLGSGPWPLEAGASTTGPSIRLRQFAEPIAAAGHEVFLAMLEGEDRCPSVPSAAHAATFSPDAANRPAKIIERARLSECQAIFGVGSLMPAFAAAGVAKALDVPCWIDFFGDPFAESHALQLRREQFDGVLRDHIWKLFRAALTAGDSFSTVSGPQRHALLGQLALAGRLGADAEVTRRVHVIPCAVPDDWCEEMHRPGFPAALSNHGIAPGTPYIYFGGSWNVWLDEGAMASSLVAALDANSTARLVINGISTGPDGDVIRQRFLHQLSPISAKIVEFTPADGVDESALMAHASASICLDRDVPESMFGSRNRLLAMIRWGATPVVSPHAEVCRDAAAAGLALIGANHDETTQHLRMLLARQAAERELARHRGLGWLHTLTFRRTTAPAVEWLASGTPRLAAPPARGMVDAWLEWRPDNASSLRRLLRRARLRP